MLSNAGRCWAVKRGLVVVVSSNLADLVPLFLLKMSGLLDPLNGENSPPTTPSKHPRLLSLDVVRGITIAVMVLVDEIGAAYPHVNHSPWNNITFADFVMPWFLFMVGTSASFSLRKFTRDTDTRWEGTRFVALRAFKLYMLGVVLQGGGWFSDDLYHYGYNIQMLRWCGILNRIGFAYLVVGLMELWVPENQVSDRRGSHSAVYLQHGTKWCVAFLFVVVHLVLTFGTFVPSWTSTWGHNSTANRSISLNGITQSPRAVLLHEPFVVDCNVRGSHDTPECSAAGYYDRLLFGQNHLGQWMSTRLDVCSTCSPGAPDRYRPDCQYKYETGPKWCFANIYDPEGALATIPTVMSAWLGTHYGRVLKYDQSWTSTTIIKHWSVLSIVLMAVGAVIHFTFFKMNKQLWSTSYLFFMAGSCGACLTLVYGLIDAPAKEGERSTPQWSKTMKKILAPMQYMGMNAILIFFWHGTAESMLDIVGSQTPQIGGGYKEETPGYLFGEGDGWFNRNVLGWMGPELAQLVYVLLKISCFAVAMWYCQRVGYFWKI